MYNSLYRNNLRFEINLFYFAFIWAHLYSRAISVNKSNLIGLIFREIDTAHYLGKVVFSFLWGLNGGPPFNSDSVKLTEKSKITQILQSKRQSSLLGNTFWGRKSWWKLEIEFGSFSENFEMCRIVFLIEISFVINHTKVKCNC